jgi:hypothetical protein
MSFDLKNKKENVIHLLPKNKSFKLNKKYNNENLLLQNQMGGKIRLIKYRNEEINDINNTINKIDNLFNPGSINISNDNSIKIEQTDYEPIKISKENNNEKIKIKNNILRKKVVDNKISNKLKPNNSFNLTNYKIFKINLPKSFRNSSLNKNDNTFNENKNEVFNKINLLNLNNSSSNNIKIKDDELTKEMKKRILVENKLIKKEKELEKANNIINELRLENETLKNLINRNIENNILLKKKEEKEENKKLNEEIKILKNEHNKNKNIINELNKQIQLLKEENNDLKFLIKSKSKSTLIFSNKNLNIK